MTEVTGIGRSVLEFYNLFLNSIPSFWQTFFQLFILVLLVTIYSIFIWKFYRYIASKNFLGLDLKQYSKSQSQFLEKILAGGLYFIEYIVVLPFLIFFWFFVFTLFLIFLTESLNLEQILIVSAIVIASIRMTSYYKEDLSKDLAKMLPFTLLAIALINPDFFDFTRIINSLNQIPEFLTLVFYYLIFIIILEIILRFFDLILSIFGLQTPNEQQNDS